MFFVGKKQGLSNTEIVSTLIKLDSEMIWLEGYLSEKKNQNQEDRHTKKQMFLFWKTNREIYNNLNLTY